jgi:hypothetical protein
VDVRGVSRHGFALNLHPDMSYWEGIIACDLPEPSADLRGRPARAGSDLSRLVMR